jgi:hypothetical protein
VRCDRGESRGCQGWLVAATTAENAVVFFFLFFFSPISPSYLPATSPFHSRRRGLETAVPLRRKRGKFGLSVFSLVVLLGVASFGFFLSLTRLSLFSTELVQNTLHLPATVRPRPPLLPSAQFFLAVPFLLPLAAPRSPHTTTGEGRHFVHARRTARRLALPGWNSASFPASRGICR